MRAMGLDVGTKTIGVALSDPLYLIAHSYITLKRQKQDMDLVNLKEIIKKEDVKEIVLGLPKHMNNKMSDSARRAISLGKDLEKAGYEIYYQDERLSTKSAQDILIESGVRRENRKQYVDRIAAAFILQQWLDKNKREIKNNG